MIIKQCELQRDTCMCDGNIIVKALGPNLEL